MKRVMQRYGAANGAFAVGVLWNGLPVAAAFECLLSAGLVASAVAVVHRRQGVKARKARAGRGDRRRSAVAGDVAASGDWPFAPEPL